MRQKPIVSRDKKHFNGLPFLRHTQCTVRLIKFYIRKGYTINEIKNLYGLTEKQISAAIKFNNRKEKISEIHNL